jgi:pimeloyl-ACP methyl ester carboxylesterase
MPNTHAPFPSAASRVGLDAASCAPAIPRRARLRGAIDVGYEESTGGEGRPIVLVHPIHVGGGSHDVRPLFDYLAHAGKRVYALDLPGFGRSDHGDRRYDDALYAAALTHFLREVVSADEEGGATVVAMSLSAEIAARVAVETPSLVASLVLLSPTGLSDRKRPSRALARIRHAALSARLVAAPLYALLASHVGLRFQLARSLSVPVPAALMDELEHAARVPGAERAPLALLAGMAFHPRPFEEVYRLVEQPTVLVYDQDPSTTFERLPELVRANPCMRPIHLPPSGGLSTHEHPATLAALVIQQQLDLAPEGEWAPRFAAVRPRRSWAA